MYIQHFIEVSIKFEEPAAFSPEEEPPELLDRLFGGPQGTSGSFGKGDIFSAYGYSELKFSVVHYRILLTIPTELLEVTHVSLFLDYQECLYYFHKLLVCSRTYCKKFIPVNWKSWILTAVFSETRKLRPFNRLRCSCTDRETMWGALARPLQAGKGEMFPDLDDAWCRTWFRLTDSPNCETQTASKTL